MTDSGSHHHGDQQHRYPRPPYPYFDAPPPLAFAHRGGACYPPNAGIENSLRAFTNAVELGYRYLETDVHATADGVCVAFHDDTLDRVTDGSGRISELTWAQVSQARIGGREPIPTLAELLRALPEARVNIDVKEESAIEPLARVLEAEEAGGRVCVASFSGHRLRRTRRLLGPAVASSLGPIPVLLACLPLPRPLLRLLLPGAACAQVPVRYGWLTIVTAGFVARLHALGKQVHVWTVDDPGEMRALLDLGVDGLITDRIEVLRDVLAERDEWHG